MSKYVIDSATLASIGDAVREKDGTTGTILVSNLATRIKAIPQEGGAELPEEAYQVKGDCQYRFAYNGWNWFLDLFGDKIDADVSSCKNMFYYSDKLKAIPFNIKLNKDGFYSVGVFTSMFQFLFSLEELPQITGELKPPGGAYTGNPAMTSMFEGCQSLREIPYDFFNAFGGDSFWEGVKALNGAGRNAMFKDCYSLRKLPDVRNLKTALTASYNYASLMYYQMCSNCYALDEIRDLPVINLEMTTNNSFSGTPFGNNHRLQAFTFETNEDGSPIVAKMQKQTVELHSNVGWAASSYFHPITYYNSGITKDKEVKDDATYQALKDDPDWFTSNKDYSRYNHDSAVETINSLPDTSAFVAEKGSPNTIKFTGAAGAKTDGGAINTLTAEEIAVATAKGWTVTLV